MKDYHIVEPTHKIEEFEAFVAAIEDGQVAHWKEIAASLGVHQDTITDWRRHPRAVAARKKGIAHALIQMEKAGKGDWRMWYEKLRMLNMGAVDKADLTSDGEKIEGVVIYKPEKNKE